MATKTTICYANEAVANWSENCVNRRVIKPECTTGERSHAINEIHVLSTWCLVAGFIQWLVVGSEAIGELIIDISVVTGYTAVAPTTIFLWFLLSGPCRRYNNFQLYSNYNLKRWTIWLFRGGIWTRLGSHSPIHMGPC